MLMKGGDREHEEWGGEKERKNEVERVKTEYEERIK